MPGQTLLADRLRDELLEEITSSQLQPGTKLPTEGELSKRFGVSRATVREAVRRPRRGRLRHPSPRIGQLCRRASANAARAGLDAELPRDDRERGRTRRDAGAGRGVRAERKDRRPFAARQGRRVLGGGAGAHRRRPAGDLLARPHPRAPAEDRPRSAEPGPIAVRAAEVVGACGRPRDRDVARSGQHQLHRESAGSAARASLCCTSRRSTTTATARPSCCRGSGTSPRRSMSGSTGGPRPRRSFSNR